MDKPGNDLAFGKGSLEIKVPFVVKLMVLKYINICIILFVSYMFYAHLGTKAFEAKKVIAVLVIGRLPDRSKELCFLTSCHGICLCCEQSKASSYFRELNCL